MSVYMCIYHIYILFQILFHYRLLQNIKYSSPRYTVNWSESHSVMSNSLWPHGLHSPWNSPGQNTGVGSLSLLHGIFPTQGSKPGLLHCRWILYQLSHKGSLCYTVVLRLLSNLYVVASANHKFPTDLSPNWSYFNLNRFKSTCILKRETSSYAF